MKRTAALLGLALALPTRSWAQEIDIIIDPALAQQAGVDAEEVRTQIRTATEGALKMDAPEAFLQQMATANAFATKGMGADYASNPQRFFAGAAVGTAVNGAGFTFVRGTDTMPEAGFAFQAAANAGLNLGFLSPDESFLRRLVVSANGMYAKGAEGSFDAELSNFGAHLQVKVIRPEHEGLLEWGGIDVTGGYEISTYRLLLTHSLPIEVEGLRWDADGQFDLTATSHTLPVEVSTNLRVFIFSVYAGGAVDIRQQASATSSASLAGPVTASSQGHDLAIGTVSARLSASGDAESVYTPRVFAGAQVNIIWAKLYGHLNVGFDDTYAGHLGVRVAM
ncbi:MAG: hypothetical protein Q8P18_27175 [Pseudomonadota bacterium]|nr:hypothetical protein [Pseudomonadota bacterium]